MQKKFQKYCSTKTSKKLYHNKRTSYHVQGLSTATFHLLFNSMATRKRYSIWQATQIAKKGQHELSLTQLVTKLEVLIFSKPCIGNQLEIFLIDANK